MEPFSVNQSYTTTQEEKRVLPHPLYCHSKIKIRFSSDHTVPRCIYVTDYIPCNFLIRLSGPLIAIMFSVKYHCSCIIYKMCTVYCTLLMQLEEKHENICNTLLQKDICDCTGVNELMLKKEVLHHVSNIILHNMAAWDKLDIYCTDIWS